MTPSLFRLPSAWIPLAASSAAFALIAGYVARFGIDAFPQSDENTPAHLFQLLMLGQAFVILYFAIKWLPQKPAQALGVLALQVIAALVPVCTILWLES